MPDHRWIEQGRRLQRILLREISADQQLPIFADRRIGEKILLRVIEAVQNELPRLLMTAMKFCKELANQPTDFIVGQRHHSRYDPKGALRVCELKRPHQYPCVIGFDENVCPLQLHSNLPVCSI